jgi:hypothetical protein
VNDHSNVGAPNDQGEANVPNARGGHAEHHDQYRVHHRDRYRDRHRVHHHVHHHDLHRDHHHVHHRGLGHDWVGAHRAVDDVS